MPEALIVNASPLIFLGNAGRIELLRAVDPGLLRSAFQHHSCRYAAEAPIVTAARGSMGHRPHAGIRGAVQSCTACPDVQVTQAGNWSDGGVHFMAGPPQPIGASLTVAVVLRGASEEVFSIPYNRIEPKVGPA